MASDRQVSARSVLRALAQVQRQGGQGAMKHLEQTEPDLAEFVFEQLSLIHQQILNLGGSSKRSQKVYLLVENLVLVAIEALRQSHYELWKQEAGEGRLAQIDPSLAEGKEQDQHNKPNQSDTEGGDDSCPTS